MWLSFALSLGATAAPALQELTPRGQSQPTVMVLRKSTPNMDTFVAGMAGELGGSFHLVALEVGRDSTVQELGEALAQVDPDALVVLDNPTAELYRRYQEANPQAPAPPVVIAMALFVEQVASRIRNATGIAYEVPAVTSFVRLRSTVQTPVTRIGVLHRPLFGAFVADQARLASIEGFEIVAVELKARPTATQVRQGLKTLDKLGVDALWVLNDNVLLQPELLVGAWLPAMRRNERPAVVGVQDLLRTKPPVGSFAVVPDHQSLGMQAAEMLFELQQGGWTLPGGRPQLPIAVETVLIRSFMEQHTGLQPGAIDQIDRVLE